MDDAIQKKCQLAWLVFGILVNRPEFSNWSLPFAFCVFLAFFLPLFLMLLFLCALYCRVANERELLFPGNWKSARFGEFLSLSCFVFLSWVFRPTVWCGVVCLISSSCLRFFFLIAAAHGVWFRHSLPYMSLVCEIPEDVAVMCRVELSCRCQVSFRGIRAFSFGFLCSQIMPVHMSWLPYRQYLTNLGVQNDYG